MSALEIVPVAQMRETAKKWRQARTVSPSLHGFVDALIDEVERLRDGCEYRKETAMKRCRNRPKDATS
jgi:hypothetical protein